jgi:hypothetical protein
LTPPHHAVPEFAIPHFSLAYLAISVHVVVIAGHGNTLLLVLGLLLVLLLSVFFAHTVHAVIAGKWVSEAMIFLPLAAIK